LKFKSDITNNLISEFGEDNIVCIHGHKANKGHNNCFNSGKVRVARRVKGVLKNSNKTNCKVLLYDIETSPIMAFIWKIWDENISPGQIIHDWFIISWSARWLFSDDTFSDVITSEEIRDKDDSRITKSLWKLLNEADVVVGHNIIGFDNKRVNTRFLVHGLPPTLPYISVDTLKVTRETFSLTSNSLAYINKFLGIPEKTHLDFSVWKDAYFGDAKALKLIGDYNKNDTIILENLFLRLRPYIKHLPNMNLWSGENISVCHACGSEHLDWTVKAYYTETGMYKGYRCKDCGAVGRSRQLELSKEKRKTVVRGL